MTGQFAMKIVGSGQSAVGNFFRTEFRKNFECFRMMEMDKLHTQPVFSASKSEIIVKSES
jgi:hypothetical protein